MNTRKCIWSALALGGLVTVAAAAPANDDFADAIVLSGDSGSLSGNTNTDATVEGGEPVCIYPETTNTVWFEWVCIQAGTVTLSTTGSMTGSGEWDSVICIYTGGALASLTPVVQQDDGVEETVSLEVTPGTYYIQVGGYEGDVATNILLIWFFDMPVVVDFSGDQTQALDNVIGAGNSGRLVGDAKTHWAGTTSAADVHLNGFELWLSNGGGNAQTYNGAISGPGTIRIIGRGDATWAPDLRLGGTVSNSPTSVIIASGRATLNKSDGVDALAGAITVTASNVGRIQLENNEQINDAATIDSAGSTGVFYFALDGYTETIAGLSIEAGDTIATGIGGVLKVDALTVDGTPQPKGAYTVSSGYVTGSGYIDVDGHGPPVITNPPTEPVSPVPADHSADVNPAYLAKLDWGDSTEATSYDVYLWESTGPKPGTPTANVPISEFDLPVDVTSLTTYNWQVVARNTQGATPGVEWTFDTVARWEIGGNLPSRLDDVVGAGNTARLIADAKTIWYGTTSLSDVHLNGFELWLSNGGGNAQTYNGAITGPGSLRITGRSDASWNPDIRLGGTIANSFDGVIIGAGRATLNKSAGVDALSGPITVTAGNVGRIQLQNDEQINDASTIDSTGSGGTFYFGLDGHTETIAGLSIENGDMIDTGTDGVLTVAALSFDGTPLDPGTYNAASHPEFITGTGGVTVGVAAGGDIVVSSVTIVGTNVEIAFAGDAGVDYKLTESVTPAGPFIDTDPLVERTGSGTMVWPISGAIHFARIEAK